MSAVGLFSVRVLVVIVCVLAVFTIVNLRSKRAKHTKYRRMLAQFREAMRTRSLPEIQMEKRYILICRESIEQEMAFVFGWDVGPSAVSDMLKILFEAEFGAVSLEPEVAGLRPGITPFVQELRLRDRVGS